MAKKKLTKRERAHLLAVRNLQCYVGFVFDSPQCSAGTQAHHEVICGRRVSHFHTVPLCQNHHGEQTPLALGEAIHHGKKIFEAKYATQREMVHDTWERLGITEEMFKRFPDG